MSVLKREFLSGLVKSTETIEQENGYIAHHLLPHLPKLITLTEGLLAQQPEMRNFELWTGLITDPEIKAYLKDHYGDSYVGREEIMMLNTLNSELLYGNANFLNRVGLILMNDQDFALIKDLFKWLKWDVSLNDGQDFLNLLKMSEICYPFLMFEKSVREWVVDYRKIQQEFLTAGPKVKSAKDVGVFKALAEFMASIKAQQNGRGGGN